jgi:hypothetical protein
VAIGNHTSPRRTRAGIRGIAPLCAVAWLMAAATGPAIGHAAAPPALPGPPPGAGSGFSAPPVPGSLLEAQPLPAGVTIPAHVSGPGLLSGTALLSGREFSVALACQASGQVSVSAPALGRGVLTRASYTCRSGRASAQLSLSRGAAGRLRGLVSTLSSVSVRQGKSTQRLSLTLQARAAPATFWSDGGLECQLLGDTTPYLAAPDFTVTPAVQIDVRPWVAWYTAANGWRWLGTAGIDASRWYRWTAAPGGIDEFKTPAGAVDPWTWAPIHVDPGQHTYAIGVFEVRYWYAHPRYAWSYAPSTLATNAASTYCTYP